MDSIARSDVGAAAPSLYERVGRVYAAGSRLTGFSAGLRRFIRRLDLALPAAPRVLEVGCGPGELSLALAARVGAGDFLVTDVEDRFLAALEARRAELPASARFSSGKLDLDRPDRVEDFRTGKVAPLEPQSYDVILAGATLGYSQSLDATVSSLLSYLKPGGVLLDVEMSQAPGGRLLSAAFKYRCPTFAQLAEIARRNGCSRPREIPFRWTELPAGLSRVGVVIPKDAAAA